ncbi:MAG TPA: MerR family transcriptional regulator [Terracidiphilus sp.]|nr:MerR family transcriptional regulator [Terracidiphilus sp.]
MLTVTKLARRCGVSRTALLYYESIGLMPPPGRTGGNYRCYSEADAERLLAIRAYRNAGLSLEDIRILLKTRSRRGGDASGVLKRRLVELDAEIEALRAHQQAILQLLGSRALRKAEMITKQKWVSIMTSCGFSQEQMHRWHSEFERSAPDEHQEFLEFLHIPEPEIKTIREQSRTGA